MRNINKIIIHCTATEEGKDIRVEDIRQWHRSNGWKDIGYHYVIYIDGSVARGRALELSGAHTLGQNANSIGICYVGGLKSNKPADTRNELQKKALTRVLRMLKRIYPHATIHGHNEFANKACPCFDVKKEFNKYD